MIDIVDRQTRARMMSGVRSKNTQPEMVIRKALHQRGYRYRLHDKSLPGRPDLVFPGKKAVIQVQGCFWHMHGCHLFRWPSTRVDFWQQKIEGNARRDQRNLFLLNAAGWRVLTVWECALKGPHRLDLDKLVDEIERWICSGKGNQELSSAAPL